MMRNLLVIPLLVISLAKNAATAATLTSTGCVDAPGLQSCMNSVAAVTTACLAQANADNSDLEVLACGCEYYTGNYNCYATHCWNRVYECEYQAYMVQYLFACINTPLGVPYFPAPNGAATPDACSCNLGDVLLAVYASHVQDTACLKNAESLAFTNPTEALQKSQGCNCCAVSAALSSIYSICPNTDPSLSGISALDTFENTIGNFHFSSCAPSLTQFNCAVDLGYAPVANGAPFYRPDNLPPNGTATLSNSPGTVTAPASGSVFTYTNGGDKQVYTIVAAKAKATSGGGGIIGNGNGAGLPIPTSQSWGEKVDISRGFLLAAFVSSFATHALLG